MDRAFSRAITSTFRSPIPEAYSWLDGMEFPPDKPLMNVSQAAPTDPPPKAMRRAMADAIMEIDDTHLYGSVLGMPALREAVARRWSNEHNATVTQDQVAITSGCNQAFVAALATLADPGDEVILPTPWYFNQKMWLDMASLRTVPLETGGDLLPRVAAADSLITSKTRAIALVSPNNPAGVEYPASLIRDFYELAKSRGIALILDETYRDFMEADAPPHDLFSDADWDQTLVQLYSFSKAYRLTGHRVGAITTSRARLAEIEKFLDTVTICPSQVGQIGALWGMNNLQDWLAAERHEILDRRQAITDYFPILGESGWKLLGLGGFFAYVEYPFDMPSAEFAKKMLANQNILALPGSMFAPALDPRKDRQLRIAFANMDRRGINELFNRLAKLAN